MGDDIRRPTLLLNPDRVRRNIGRMAEKAARASLRFRPHFKTHQSAAVGEWFRPFGVKAVTVSSVEMAEYFAAHGWSDITIAFPVNIREIAALDRLAGRIRLGLLLEAAEAVPALAEGLTAPVDVWLKIDVGAGRAGLSWTRPGEASALARLVRDVPRLRLRGLLTHAGHSYRAGSPEGIRSVHRDQMERLRAVRSRLAADGMGGLELSIGDTPTCRIVEDLSGADEIRPGNFVLFDLMQLELGTCREEDVAAVLACPVVAVQRDRGRMLVHGGAIHLTEASLPGSSGPVYGRAVRLDETGWSPLRGSAVVTSVSQEHGLVTAGEEVLRSFRVGDLVGIMPVHSCLTVRAMRSFRTPAGDVLETL
jgi:D-serine deaminase-like pyridoxal phosphate-dependent protein